MSEYRESEAGGSGGRGAASGTLEEVREKALGHVLPDSKLDAHQERGTQGENMERATGFEPATFSLGS